MGVALASGSRIAGGERTHGSVCQAPDAPITVDIADDEAVHAIEPESTPRSSATRRASSPLTEYQWLDVRGTFVSHDPSKTLERFKRDELAYRNPRARELYPVGEPVVKTRREFPPIPTPTKLKI
jgi:hypothetical protein